MSGDFEIVIYKEGSVERESLSASENEEAVSIGPNEFSSSDEDLDIASLLQKATNALAGRKRKRTPQSTTQPRERLIENQYGVAKLNPNVLQQQTVTTIEASSTEKSKTKRSDWFELKTPQMTEALKRDLQVLRMRSILDPKRHYRKENTRTSAAHLPKTFEVGTIIADHTESSSHKIRRKDQKETIVEELLNDMTRKEYYKRKTAEIDAKKRSGAKGFYKSIKDRRGSKFSRK